MGDVQAKISATSALARLALLGVGSVFAGPALSQTAPPAASGSVNVASTTSADQAATADGQLTDIVITAQRRSENLQRVPISVQVINSLTLAQQNLQSPVAISDVEPSIHVGGSGRSSNYYIRGTGSGESQSFDQSVGTFIDDIYHGRSRNSGATFLDLDHVEILKGPQSTFFGNNAIAGALNIVTAKPTDTFGGWARGLISPVSGETDRQYALEGALNVPLTDNLAVRVAGTVNGERGYLTNVNTGSHAPDRDNYAFRATATYRPTDVFDVTLKGEVGGDINKGGLVLRQTACPPDPSFGGPRGFCAVNLAAGAPTGLDNSLYTANPGNETRLHTYEAVLTANYHVGDNTITSVTGYTGYHFNLNLDDDGTALQLINVQAPEEYHQFSQELRLASPTGNKTEFLAGAYYQQDQLRIQQSVSYFFLTPTIASIPPFAALVPFLPLGQQINAVQRTKTYSGFGSLSWNINDKLKLTGGLRGTIVTKGFDWNLFYGTASQAYGGIVTFPAALQPLPGALGLGTAGSVGLNRNDKALLPSAKVQYQIEPHVMTYFSYSRGFKAGGFSVAELSADPANYPFGPEHVDAYEVGLKSELFDRRVSLDVAIFREDFSDLQVVIDGNNAAGALINYVRNAAASRAQGVEVEARWVVNPAFRLSAEGTYLDSKYSNYKNAGPTYAQQLAGQATQDLSGRPTLYAPQWSGNVTGTLTLPVARDYRLTAEAIGIFSSSYYTIFTVDPVSRQPSYARLDARISMDSANGRWGLDVIGKNLTNTLVRTFTGYQPGSFGSLFQDREQFRNVAFQLRYKF